MAEKAVIKVEGGSEIEVMFNPESYQLSQSASYSEKKIPGLDGPVSQFISGESMTLDMTLYFDTYVPPTAEKGESGTNAAAKVGELTKLLKIDGSLHRPPSVSFCWGNLKFYGCVTSVKASYTMFLADGTPVRAKADVSFRSLLDADESRRQAPFESPDRTKVRVLHENEQLWHYAWQEYGDAERWREIARRNGIENPLDIEAGMTLTLPAL
ncbi:MAG: phage tail protein [bacterium]|nr:phage tail protein [bacterium]